MTVKLVVAVECWGGKRRNLGTIIRCSAAMGAGVIMVIGQKRIGTHGSHGAQTRVQLLHFYYWSEAIAYLRSNADQVRLYGIAPTSALPSTYPSACTSRLHTNSVNVATYKFDPANHNTLATVFVVGNKDTGLSDEIKDHLEAILHVQLPNPLYSTRFHPDSVLTICLHHYMQTLIESQAMQPTTRSIVGEKFILDETVNRRGRLQKQLPQRHPSDATTPQSEQGGDDDLDEMNIFSLFICDSQAK